MSDYKALVADLRDADQANWKRLSLDAAAAIEDLQAQLPKRGEWIYHPKDAIEMMFTLPKCSICGHESSDALNYCPNCGAKIEVQE